MVVRVAGNYKRFISCSKRPDRLCGPPSLISLGSEGTFPYVMKLTTLVHQASYHWVATALSPMS